MFVSIDYIGLGVHWVCIGGGGGGGGGQRNLLCIMSGHFNAHSLFVLL